MVGSPSAPVLCVRRGVDHHAGQQQRDDQPEHATRDDVHNGADNGGDDHAYGHELEELTGTQSEPFVSIIAGGLVHARLLPTAHRVCPGPPVRRLWLEPRTSTRAVRHMQHLPQRPMLTGRGRGGGPVVWPVQVVTLDPSGASLDDRQ